MNSDRTEANIEAYSADFPHLNQNFGNFKQNIRKSGLNKPKSFGKYLLVVAEKSSKNTDNGVVEIEGHALSMEIA